MRVLHLITGLKDGGAEAVLYRLLTHDGHHSHHVVCLSGEAKYGPMLRAEGIPVTILDMPRGWVTLRGLWRFWCIVRSSRPDLIQTWMYHADLLGGVVAWLARLPVVWGLRNTTLDTGRSSRITRFVVRLCARLSHFLPYRIISCSHAAVEVHSAIGYDTTRLIVIPNGYDLSFFRPDLKTRERLRLEWNVPADVPLIGMVARFDPQKDHSNLIASLKRLRLRSVAFRAILIGQGMEMQNRWLYQRIDDAGLRPYVLLLGARMDIPALFSAIDIHVLSSASGEAFPNVIAEAMACGTPCVTTDVGDARLIVAGHGWVVPPRDPEALTDAVLSALQLWSHPHEWNVLQSDCRERICQDFGLDVMLERYHALWSECIDRTSTSAVR